MVELEKTLPAVLQDRHLPLTLAMRSLSPRCASSSRSAKINWIFDPDDIAKVKTFLAQHHGNCFVQSRIKRNLCKEKPAVRVRFRAVLTRGSACGCAKTAGTCRELLRGEVSRFLFAVVDGVEPTNNAAERALRHGVLWRKMSHGPKSAVGSKYLERIWSVVETCRQQGRGVWDYLTSYVAAAAEGRVLPTLLTVPSDFHAA
jgi:hypothetical protein